jgi:dTDP-4-amino-4,6-dideoxygalactose transaminase
METARADTGHERFSIGFDHRDRARLHELWDGILDSERWSEGEVLEWFEAAWERETGIPAVGLSGWAAGAACALEFAGVWGEKVLCPSNTFMATPLSILRAGGEPVFVDCNREDLCVSFEDFERKAERHRPRAAMLVHIGGHVAFEVERIASYCRANGIYLIEDCAHAHGAAWNGASAGGWGNAGVYSLYATKTISAGEGGVLVTRDPELREFARAHRNYGKPEHRVQGTNGRMSEFTAALGLVGIERLAEIVEWKNAVARERLDPVHPNRVQLPEGMVSGLYKYIVFDPIERSTGKVYEEPCHRILRHPVELPNTDWVAQNHWCAPLYYAPPAGREARRAEAAL